MPPPKSVIEANKRKHEKLLKLRQDYNNSPQSRIVKQEPRKKIKPKHKRKKRKRPGLNDRVVKHWKSYQEYCKSDTFKIWKRAILKKYKYKCQMCGGRAQTAHHTNYTIWGRETLNDGIAICNGCHKHYHYNEPWWARE